MNCEQFEDLLVSDTLDEREAAKAHAADCPRCAALWREDLELAQAVEAWKAVEPAPPRRLERRIAAAVAERQGRPRRHVAAWRSFAAAAVLALTALALWQLGVPLERQQVSPVERALREAETTRARYVEAIAELERQTKPLLARAADPALAAEEAALLLRYRDRLTHLDSVLEEVQTFLEEHPGHAGAHSVLLAAYLEKQQVLTEVLRLDRGDAS